MPTAQNTSPQPLISFIVTTYNLPVDMLRECIQSIMALTLRPEERQIIIIDDGSEVSPVNDLVAEWDDILYLRQPNQGLSVARNMGIRMATGRFLQFVDGDDKLLTVAYNHCLDMIRYQQDLDIMLFCETNNEEPGQVYLPQGPQNGVAYMHQNNLRASACGYIFRASMLGSLRFTPGLLHEDEEFTPQLMLRAEHVWSTKSAAYYYRQRPGSITMDDSKRTVARRLDDTFSIILHLQDIANHAPEIDRVALNRRVAQLSMDYLYNTIVYTHSHRHLMENINRLREHGLFPLPDKRYTKKYIAFRRLINTAIGRRILEMSIR